MADDDTEKQRSENDDLLEELLQDPEMREKLVSKLGTQVRSKDTSGTGLETSGGKDGQSLDNHTPSGKITGPSSEWISPLCGGPRHFFSRPQWLRLHIEQVERGQLQ